METQFTRFYCQMKISRENRFTTGKYIERKLSLQIFTHLLFHNMYNCLNVAYINFQRLRNKLPKKIKLKEMVKRDHSKFA